MDGRTDATAPAALVGRRIALGGLVGATGLALAACANAATGGQVTGTNGASTGAAGRQQVFLTVMGSIKLAPDGKLHDAFIPADFTVVQGRPVDVTVYNYDDAPHSFTSAALGLNPTIAPSQKKGVPQVATFTFTPAKTGKFLWACDLPCDGDANGWAMSNPGYMSGYVTVVPA